MSERNILKKLADFILPKKPKDQIRVESAALRAELESRPMSEYQKDVEDFADALLESTNSFVRTSELLQENPDINRMISNFLEEEAQTFLIAIIRQNISAPLVFDAGNEMIKPEFFPLLSNLYNLVLKFKTTLERHNRKTTLEDHVTRELDLLSAQFKRYDLMRKSVSDA